jgi:hypothetical protein
MGEVLLTIAAESGCMALIGLGVWWRLFGVAWSRPTRRLQRSSAPKPSRTAIAGREPGMPNGNCVCHPLFARFFDRLSRLMEREVAEHRQELLAGLSGWVLEIGAGNGMNFRH